MSKTKDTKNKVLHVRVDEDMDFLLNIHSEITDRKKSAIIRQALINHLNFILVNPKTPNPKITISQSMVKILLDNVDNEVIQKLAQTSYHHQMEDMAYLESLDLRSWDASQTQGLDMIREVINYVFAPLASGWFRDIELKDHNKEVEITGEHYMGRKFHEFIKELLDLNFGGIGYELSREEFEERIITQISGDTEIQLTVYRSRFFYQNE